MNVFWSFTVLLANAVFFNTAECAITGWTNPSIATADGNAALTEKINTGATTTDTTGITVTATSGTGTVSTYTLVSQTPTSPVLAIDDSGVVTVKSGTVRYSSATSFTLVVSADDSGNSASTATVTLSVNAAPTISTHSSTTCIADASTAGVSLIDLEATDSNSGTTFTWAIASGNTGPDFEITSAGLIKVASGKTLALATTASYTLIITAADDSSTPLTATSTVTASVQTTCPANSDSSATAVAVSLMTILAALIATKVC